MINSMIVYTTLDENDVAEYKCPWCGEIIEAGLTTSDIDKLKEGGDVWQFCYECHESCYIEIKN